MPVESLLAYALGMIGALLGLLIGLVVYVFVSLKSEVKSVATEVATLNVGRIKLIHRDDCRSTTDRIHERLDGQMETIRNLDTRLSVLEVKGGLP